MPAGRSAARDPKQGLRPQRREEGGGGAA